MPLDCCLLNIHLLLLTTFILHPLLLNGNIPCTSQLMKRIKIWLFIYLLKRDNYLESLLQTIDRYGYLLKLSSSNSKVFWNKHHFHLKGNNILFHSLLKIFHMFSIRIWKDGGCNAKVICIKCNNYDRTVTYHLSSEEIFNIVITPFVIYPIFQYVGSLWIIGKNKN